MVLDLDTFLVTVYVIIDDLYQEHAAPHKPTRPGPKPTLADSEVLTLVVCRHWLGYSERAMGRFAAAYWHDSFPQLLSQSAFNLRARDLALVLVHLTPVLAAQLEAALCAYQVLDGLPLPLVRRCRGQYHRLFADEASIGRGGSDRDWYYGCHLWLAVTASGVITGFVLAPPTAKGVGWLMRFCVGVRIGWPNRGMPIRFQRTSAGTNSIGGRPARSGRATAWAWRAWRRIWPMMAWRARPGSRTGRPTTLRWY